MPDLASNSTRVLCLKGGVRSPRQRRETLHSNADKEEAVCVENAPSHSAQLSAAYTSDLPGNPWKSLSPYCLQAFSLIRQFLRVSSLWQGEEDPAHQLLEGGASATTFSMCRWLRPSRGQSTGHVCGLSAGDTTAAFLIVEPPGSLF